MAEMQEEKLTPPNLKSATSYVFGESRAALSAIHDWVTHTLKGGAREQQKLADQLAALLGGDCTPDAKLFLCRELARIATEDNAKEIAELLDDPATADLARYALHPITGDKVEKALIAKLKNADTRKQILIINSLGARGNPESAATLEKFSDDKEESVAQAAKAALARLA